MKTGSLSNTVEIVRLMQHHYRVNGHTVHALPGCDVNQLHLLDLAEKRALQHFITKNSELKVQSSVYTIAM